MNLRYISYPQIEYSFPLTLSRLWNLQTLIARHTTALAPPEIWKMPLLRHVQFYNISLPDPPSDSAFVLENLKTLFTITIWDCRDKVVERIPNIKKIKICQGQLECWSVHYLNNLGCLHKLESLEIGFTSFQTIPSPLDLLSKLTFPHSLTKLTLYGTRLPWGDMATKIGSLPLLQVLKLKWDSFVGSEWETFEGQFCSLKSLLIHDCGLVYWTIENTHFPCLEHLQLGFLKELKEIPFALGEIPTLQSIKLVACSSPLVSARGILEDQRDNYGNDVLQLHIDNFISYKLHIG